jgi:hypothetical protein
LAILLQSLARNLFRCDPDAGGKPQLVRDARPQQHGDLDRGAEQPHAAAHVEERLVERERLDQRGHRPEDVPKRRRDLAVNVEPRRDDDGRRAASQRLRHRHRRCHAVPPGLVGGARHDAARAGATHHQGTATQPRVVPGLDRRVERVHVDVQDRLLRLDVALTPLGSVRDGNVRSREAYPAPVMPHPDA